jgi:hypothetical protein
MGQAALEQRQFVSDSLAVSRFDHDWLVFITAATCFMVQVLLGVEGLTPNEVDILLQFSQIFFVFVFQFYKINYF